MSQIDSSLAPGLRALLLSEIQELLPAFLSAASMEREGPVNAAVELLGLPESDLRRVLAVHMMLSPPVREFVTALPTGIRRPLTSSVRPRVASRTVTTGIDWVASTRHRATSSPLGDIWVTRPANRIFDVPENRALAWVLRVLAERAAMAVGQLGEAQGPWVNEIRSMSATIRQARRTAWLEAVPATWPGDEAYFRLKADRMGFYRLRVTDAARYLRQLLIAPTSADIGEALSQRYFEPKQDWKLFEIAVLLRISSALSAIGARANPTRLFHDNRMRPFAVYHLTSTRQIRVWYQAWPPATRPSELDDAIRHYGLPSGGTRPDIVVEIVDDGISVRALLIELKASGSSSYLSSGLSQLLGYMRDRPALFTAPASGWLVAPASPTFASKPPGGRALWVISADDVAAAVVSTTTAAPRGTVSALSLHPERRA